MDDVTDARGNQKCNVHKFLSKLFKILKVGIYANLERGNSVAEIKLLKFYI